MTRAKFFESFGYAFSGIVAALHEGRNFKVQLCFAVFAVVLGFACRIEPIEWVAVCICIGAVLGGECFNTAIEAVVDLASPARHELARRAKDCAAGAVLVASLASLAVGCIIFIPRLFGLVDAIVKLVTAALGATIMLVMAAG